MNYFEEALAAMEKTEPCPSPPWITGALTSES